METTADMSAMETPAVNREEKTAVYEADVSTGSSADQLTQTIRSVLQHSYHFLGDMIVSEVSSDWLVFHPIVVRMLQLRQCLCPMAIVLG